MSSQIYKMWAVTLPMPTLLLRDNQSFRKAHLLLEYRDVPNHCPLYSFYFLIYYNLTFFPFTANFPKFLTIAYALFLLFLTDHGFFLQFLCSNMTKTIFLPILWEDIKKTKWTVRKQKNVSMVISKRLACSGEKVHMKLLRQNISIYKQESIWREQSPIIPHTMLVRVPRLDQ